MTEVDSDPILKETSFKQEQMNLEEMDSKIEIEDFKQLSEIKNRLEQFQFAGKTSDVKSKEEDQETKQEEEIFTRDLVDINRNNVNFNKNILFPGSVEEIDITASLKDSFFFDDSSDSTYSLRIMVTCHNKQFADLDQYVFSVRSNQRYEYYDEVYFRIRKSDRAEFKVAVKIPVCKEGTAIDGTLSIQLQNAVPIFLPIISKCEIPNISCLKILENTNGVQLLKISAKKGARLPPLPFKNLSNMSCCLQIQTVTSQNISERAYDIGCPSSIVCAANSPFFIMLQLKNNLQYEGPVPKTDIIRKILILKVKNSSLYYSYPIEVYVYDSTNGSSVS